jgi:hypothetical protein
VRQVAGRGDAAIFQNERAVNAGRPHPQGGYVSANRTFHLPTNPDRKKSATDEKNMYIDRENWFNPWDEKSSLK